jgi:hypothetical protein
VSFHTPHQFEFNKKHFFLSKYNNLLKVAAMPLTKPKHNSISATRTHY